MEKYLNSTILVVDDEPANIFFLEGLLDGEGYNSLSASNGAEALEMLANNLVDCVLLDVMMPNVDGIQVLKQMQTDQKLCDIPVIMVTAKTDEKDIEKALDAGAVDYIKKPINEIELLARMRTALHIKNREDTLKRLLKQNKQFVSIISHDLRAPFTSIIGFSQLLSDSKALPEKEKEFASFILTDSMRQLDYLEKLLNMAQLESGKLKPKIETIPIDELISEAEKIFGAKMQDKEIAFRKEIQSGVSIVADRSLFGQVINNLISNATKFTQKGGEIVASASSSDEGIRITISDTGVGIKEKNLSKIFLEYEKFYTLDSEGEKGTGLGLSIAKKILDAHGFSISVSSKIGSGTQFTIIAKNFT